MGPAGTHLAYSDGLTLWITSLGRVDPRRIHVPAVLAPLQVAWGPGNLLAFQGVNLDCSEVVRCVSTGSSEIWTIAPDGTALPCHAARQLPGLTFPNVCQASLHWIWYESPAFNAFRGEAWMREPCRSCPERQKDFGGCRCQAYLLTGDAANTDPVCDLSPLHHVVLQAVADVQESQPTGPLPMFRNVKNSKGLTV